MAMEYSLPQEIQDHNLPREQRWNVHVREIVQSLQSFPNCRAVAHGFALRVAGVLKSLVANPDLFLIVPELQTSLLCSLLWRMHTLTSLAEPLPLFIPYWVPVAVPKPDDADAAVVRLLHCLEILLSSLGELGLRVGPTILLGSISYCATQLCLSNGVSSALFEPWQRRFEYSLNDRVFHKVAILLTADFFGRDALLEAVERERCTSSVWGQEYYVRKAFYGLLCSRVHPLCLLASANEYVDPSLPHICWESRQRY